MFVVYHEVLTVESMYNYRNKDPLNPKFYYWMSTFENLLCKSYSEQNTFKHKIKGSSKGIG